MERGLTKPTDVVGLSFDFAVSVVKVVAGMPKSTIGFELGKQFLRAGTSIGANIEEAQGGRTKREFINSMNIAKREARETRFWLRVLKASNVLPCDTADALIVKADQLTRILTAIVKTSEGH